MKAPITAQAGDSNEFYDFEAPEKRKVQPGEEAASLPACAIGAFIGLHLSLLLSRIWLGLRFNDNRSSKLNVILKVEF